MSIESEIHLGTGISTTEALEGLVEIGEVALAVGLIIGITAYGINYMLKGARTKS